MSDELDLIKEALRDFQRVATEIKMIVDTRMKKVEQEMEGLHTSQMIMRETCTHMINHEADIRKEIEAKVRKEMEAKNAG